MPSRGRASASPTAVGSFLESLDYDDVASRTTEDSLAKTIHNIAVAKAAQSTAGAAATTAHDPDLSASQSSVEHHRAGEADWILRAAVRGMNAAQGSASAQSHRHQSQLPIPHEAVNRTGRDSRASGGPRGRSGMSLRAGFHMVPAEDVVEALSSTFGPSPATSRAFARSEPNSASFATSATAPYMAGPITPAPKNQSHARRRVQTAPFTRNGHRLGTGHSAGLGSKPEFAEEISSEVNALEAQYEEGLSDLRSREFGLLQKLKKLQALQEGGVCFYRLGARTAFSGLLCTLPVLHCNAGSVDVPRLLCCVGVVRLTCSFHTQMAIQRVVLSPLVPDLLRRDHHVQTTTCILEVKKWRESIIVPLDPVDLSGVATSPHTD